MSRFGSNPSPAKRASSSLLLTIFFLMSLIFSITILTIDSQQRQERLIFTAGKKPFTKTLNLLNLMLKGPKNKISPLYLINGTVCRYINNTPICTVLATSGLQTGQGSPGASSSSRPSSGSSQGGSSGGSSGSGSGGGGGGGSSSGSGSGGGGSGGGGGRVSTAGQLGSSSVQYLGRPLADDSLDLQVSSSGGNELQTNAAIQPVNFGPNMGLFVRRRPLGLVALRRPLPMLRPQQH